MPQGPCDQQLKLLVSCNGLGTVAMSLLCNSNGWLACRIADTNSAWGQSHYKMHQFREAPSWRGWRGPRR